MIKVGWKKNPALVHKTEWIQKFNKEKNESIYEKLM